MSTAIALWSLPLPAGQIVKFHAIGDIRVTGAALDAEIADEKSRSTIKLTYEKPTPLEEDDEEETKGSDKVTTVLCALTPGKIEQATLDLVLPEEDEFVFENKGKNLIYLTGNYIDQGQDEPPEDFDSDSDSDDEEGYPLLDVSSDVEIDPRDLDLPDSDEEEGDSHRFEEVKGVEKPKSKKRPRDSDAMEVEGDGEKKVSKKEKKALKKQKSDDGKAVPTAEVARDEKAPKEKKEKKVDSAEDFNEAQSGLQVKDVKVGSGKAAKKG